MHALLVFSFNDFNGSLMVINAPVAVKTQIVFLCNLEMYLKESNLYHM